MNAVNDTRDNRGENTLVEGSVSEDFGRVPFPARIACYDDPKAAPHIIEIKPNTTLEYIEELASTVYEQSHKVGGSIAYTAIREIAENFIHARFAEIVVSILDHGNTIRFADQGPGIERKDQALRPGFTSATEPMKKFIRGVGSGFPLTAEYLEASHGSITIEDNLNAGVVVTLSLVDRPAIETRAKSATTYASPIEPSSPLVPPFTEREKVFISFFLREGTLGVTELASLTGVAQSSTYNILKKLEEEGIVEKLAGQKKRSLTDFGYQVARTLSSS